MPRSKYFVLVVLFSFCVTSRADGKGLLYTFSKYNTPKNHQLDVDYASKMFQNWSPPLNRVDCVSVHAERRTRAFDFAFKILHRELKLPILSNSSLEWALCHYYVVAGKSMNNFVATLLTLKRWFDHSIIGLIYEENANVFHHFLKTGAPVFKESEVILVWLNQRKAYWKADGFFKEVDSDVWIPTDVRGGQNLSGRTVNIVGSNSTIFVKFGDVKKGVPGWSRGVELAMWKEIAKRMNVSWRVAVPNRKQNKWSFQANNGTWVEGIFDKLLEGEVDLGLGCIWITANKLKTVQFSAPISEVCIGHLVPRPVPEQPDWRSTFYPFSTFVWALIVVSAVSTTIALWAISKRSRNKRIRRQSGLGECALIVATCLVVSSLPKWRMSRDEGCLVGRHLVYLWSVFCLLTAAAYSSSLVSHLTTPLYTKKADTVRDMVEAGYHWGTPHNLDMSTVLDSTDPWNLAWSRRFIRIRSREEHVARVRGPNFALWGQRIEQLFLLNEEYFPPEALENYEASKHCTSRFFYGFAHRRGSPLAQPVDRYLFAFIESGIYHKILTDVGFDFIKEYPYAREVVRYTSVKKEKKNGASRNILGVRNLEGVFYLIINGLALSIIVFLLEIFGYYRNVFDFTE